MSNNPGKGTSSIYQENSDAFSSQLDLSTSRHLSPQAKANGQVNRLSKVFDTPSIHKDPHTPPPPPSKPQALRSSSARKTQLQDESEAACQSPSQSTVTKSSRSSLEFCKNTPPQSPGMSFKDLQAKFQQAALDSDHKAVSFHVLFLYVALDYQNLGKKKSNGTFVWTELIMMMFTASSSIAVNLQMAD